MIMIQRNESELQVEIRQFFFFFLKLLNSYETVFRFLDDLGCFLENWIFANSRKCIKSWNLRIIYIVIFRDLKI